VDTSQESAAILDHIWNELTENRPGEPFDLNVLGRKIYVPKQVKGIARFDFKYLCEKPLGAADYSAVASKFHTIVMDNIPQFNHLSVNEARRFITFIDEVYEQKSKIICSANALPNQLFHFNFKKDGSVSIGEEEAFAFNRTASRLFEMQTAQYLEQPHTKKAKGIVPITNDA